MANQHNETEALRAEDNENPFEFKHKEGDMLKLLPSEGLRLAHAAMRARLPKRGPVRRPGWLPPLHALKELRSVQFCVEGRCLWHLGVKLYTLTFTQDGEPWSIRLCEELLQPVFGTERFPDVADIWHVRKIAQG